MFEYMKAITYYQCLKLKYDWRESRMKKINKDKRNAISADKVVLNGVILDKIAVVKFLKDWVDGAFVFQNRKVHLPLDTELPVNGIDEELVDLKVFEKTGMGALEYLITCVLAVGIKIGREMEAKERESKDREDD